jgi:superoxide dismutase, Cu-Zn family
MKPNPFVVRGVALCAGAVLACVPAQAQSLRKAKATLNSCANPSVNIGTAFLVELPSSEAVKTVEVLISVRGLTPGKHAVHIHEFGECGSTTAVCGDAGSHLDLGPFAHNLPVQPNHPYHSGDLVNINVGSDGRGTLLTTTTRVALSENPERPVGRELSVFDDDGSSIIIHALDDEYCPDPADPNCAGGGRVACGVIVPAN